MSLRKRVRLTWAGLLTAAFAFATAIPLPAFAAGEIEAIRAAGKLRVCIWPDYFGISYRNPRTGDLQGVDIDLSRAFARELGVGLEYVETDFNRLVEDLNGNRCDAAMMGVGVTTSRLQRLDFSAPYLRSDIFAIVTKSSPIQNWSELDVPGRVIVVQQGTFMEPVMRKQLKRASLVAVQRPNEREREVQSGRADAFMTDYPYSRRMLMNTDWARVVEPNEPISMTDYAYAVAKGRGELLARLNAFVAAVKSDGRLASAAQPHGLLPIIVRE